MLLSTILIVHSAVVLDLRALLSGLHLYCHEIETSAAYPGFLLNHELFKFSC